MTADDMILPDADGGVRISLADANCIVLCLDADGRIVFLNAFGLAFFGYRRNEILGRHAVGTIVPPTDHDGHDLAAMINDLLRQPDTRSHQINQNRRKNGDQVWVVWSNRAIYNADGELDHLLCVGNDITDRKAFETVLESSRLRLTEQIQKQNDRLQAANRRLQEEIEARKQAQQELKENRDRYRLYSQASTEGILFHTDGIVLEANQALAQLLETTREQLIGSDIIQQFVSPEDIDEVYRRLSVNEDQVYEIMVHSTSGRTFPAELRTRPGELDGQPCRVVAVRDISHRKKTERQLIQSQKMEAVGTLAGGIAHDFNNLLAGIQGNVELLRHRLPEQSPHQKRLGIITQIIQRGAKLSGQLLGYARGGQDQMSEIDLNRLVEETIDMFGHTQRHVDLHTRLNEDTPRIKGDRTQIEQVLLNLMINAVQAMPAGGDLFIETCPTELSARENREYEIVPGHYAMLTVRDTGHGMDRETQKLVFEPFFTTKAHGEGTGLGLASTYGIVKNHKGYIEVYSETDIGTQFNILLPRATTADTPTRIEGATPETGTGTILIVDDEPDFLDVGRELLTMLGYTVLIAETSAEALERCRQAGGEIDIAMLDVVMPGPPVENTIRQLREIDPAIRILLTSGYSRRGKMVRDALPAGDGFIQKPFRLISLSRTIKALMAADGHEN